MKFIEKNKRWIGIASTFLAIALIIIGAVCFEYVINAARYIPEEERTLLSMGKINLSLENAYQDADGSIVALEDNAKVMIKCNYIKTLRVDFKDPENAECSVIAGEEIIECEPESNIAINAYYPAHYSLNLKQNEQNEQNEQNCTITINKKGSVITNIEIDNRYVRNNRLIAALIICGLIILTCVIMVSRRRLNGDKLFIILALVLVVSYATILPTNTQVSWDEHIHYSNIASISPGTSTAAERKLSRLEEVLTYDIVDDARNIDELNTLDSTKISKSELFTEEVSGNPVLVAYNYVAYLPAAGMLSLCRLLGLEASTSLILMRLFTGILYAILCYIGIKRLKYGKSIYAILALCPISIFQATVCTYDWWVTSLLFLGSAYLIRELQEPSVALEKSNYFIMLIAFFIGCGPKAIYFLMMAAMLLMGENKYRSKRQYKISQGIICAVMIIVLASFMLPFFIGGPGTGDSRGGAGINAAEQVSFIFHNPIKYTVIFAYHCVQYLLPGNLATYLTFLAYVDSASEISNSCGILLIVMLVIAIMTDRNDEEKGLLKLKNRLVIIGIFILTVLLISTALYVSFTSVGRLTIQGVQGRYLLPLSFLTLMFLRPQSIRTSWDMSIEQVVMSSLTALTTMATIAAICVKFY